MSKELSSDDKLRVKRLKPEVTDPASEKQHPAGPDHNLLHLQQTVGNQAVQRLLAQRSGDGAFDLDEATANQINQARGGGQPLDSTMQRQMSGAMGHDLSQVRVHTSPEADTLNQQLNAKAFTTGQDIFFKQGEYNPGSSSGQELIAHEVTHVVQQSSGLVGSGGSGMKVNPPGDVYEQEADAVAKQMSTTSEEAGSASSEAGSVQRAEMPEDEMQLKPEDTLQRQEGEELEEEEMLQRQEEDELEEEEMLQRQEGEELEEEEMG